MAQSTNLPSVQTPAPLSIREPICIAAAISARQEKKSRRRRRRTRDLIKICSGRPSGFRTAACLFRLRPQVRLEQGGSDGESQQRRLFSIHTAETVLADGASAAESAAPPLAPAPANSHTLTRRSCITAHTQQGSWQASAHCANWTAGLISY